MSGRKPTVGDEVFLRAIEASDSPVASTTEIQQFVGFETPKGARDRLVKLKQKGLVDMTKIGRAQAWWLTDDGRASLEDRNET